MIENKNPENSPVCYIKGIGEKRAKQLAKLGINTASDLVTHYPRGYIDFNKNVEIANAPVNEYCVIKAKVLRKLPAYYGRIQIFKVIIGDESDSAVITFFNNVYSFQRLCLDKEYCFYGKFSSETLRREMTSPIFVDADKSNQLMPRYKLTEGLSHNIISNCIKNTIESFSFDDCFTNEFKKEYNLINFSDALRLIHFPKTEAEYSLAKRRLTFEELFFLQVGLRQLKSRNEKLTGAVMTSKDISDYYTSLPFELTSSQKNAIEDCIKDMQKTKPMNRLLQGDVGSGKTAVAAGVCYYAFLNGMQSTLMAPTEILAKQHYNTLCSFLKPLGVRIEVLTGAFTSAEKKKIRERIKNGDVDIVVGTQALIQKNTEFKNLGLVVADEQHRFGVQQRALLSGKGENPHILVMSATPIPRTLAFIIYGDLDISILSEMPKGRLPIKTYGVDSSYHERLYKFILKYVQNGFQAYIVCPLIDEGISEKASAVNYIESLQKTCLKDVPTGILHGKMKQAEKDKAMEQFKNKETMILVSTTVIEVGVDVPNAVIMLIENAEQFGLSQLHQLRGRVGRGSEQSHCVLISDSDSEYTKARIGTMVKTSNGFEIANEDLKLRGPGDFFGNRQHGLPELRIADIYTDYELLEETKNAAKNILDSDPALTNYPDIKRRIERLFENAPDA